MVQLSGRSSWIPDYEVGVEAGRNGAFAMG
jgi:hypothetical protein